MRKILFIATCFAAFNAPAQNVGIGTTIPLQKLDVRGNQYISDSLGIGSSSPHAPLQFSNANGRKIVLYEAGNNNNQYYGIAIDPSTLRFQTGNSMSFKIGTSSTTSYEAMKITNVGNIGIGNSNPTAPLHFTNNFLSKKLALYDTSSNDNQFYGFGVTSNLLNYQSQGDHVFYAGTSATSSTELLRISNNGKVGIGVSQPHAQIHLANTTGRKIILYEDNNNDNEYYGIAIEPANLRFQSPVGMSFNIYSSPTSSDQMLKITGNGVGIGHSEPTAPLQFGSYFLNRKLVLFDTSNNPHQFYGFGAMPGLLNYQSQGDHVFYVGTSPSDESELIRFRSNGLIGVGIPDPLTKFSNTNLNIIAGNGSGVGLGSITWQMSEGGYIQALHNASTALNAQGLAIKIAGTNPGNHVLDLSTGETPDVPGLSVMVVQGDGKVGIGDNDPVEKLVVNGAVKIGDGGYTSISNNATTPVPAGGAGTMVFVNGNFYGWTGTQWKQLNN